MNLMSVFGRGLQDMGISFISLPCRSNIDSTYLGSIGFNDFIHSLLLLTNLNVNCNGASEHLNHQSKKNWLSLDCPYIRTSLVRPSVCNV